MSKRQQKKLLKKRAAKEGRLERKAAKKELHKVQSAAKKKEIDERFSKMTAEEQEAHRQRAQAASRVHSFKRPHLDIDMLSGISISNEDIKHRM